MTAEVGGRAVVMTFNLRRASVFDGPDAWKYRRGRAAEAIRAGNPDFVGTQEASCAMMRELAAMLPDFGWLGEGRRGGERDETNAILYRYDRWVPAEAGTFWLSGTPGRPGSRGWGALLPRICTWALFRSRQDPGMLFAVFNAHLDHVSRLARRLGAALAAERLLELRRRTGAPAALTGDFNAAPESEPLLLLTRPPYDLINVYEAYPGGPGAVGPTYHGFRGRGFGGPIDGIFATPDCAVEAVAVDRNKYGGRYPSDHFPVVAHLRWGGKAG